MEIKVHKQFCLSFREVPTSLKILCDNVSGTLELFGPLKKPISLVRTKVDEVLLNTMIRFYDPFLHCFTYKDFKLVPTLEEFESILGLLVLDQIPYTGEKEIPKLEDVAAALHLPLSEIKKVWLSKGEYSGLPIGFLYSKAEIMIKATSMDALEKVLALLIYGQVLFPRYDKIIDVIAIKIFIGNNPVPTLLGNLLHSIHCRSSKGKGCILGCAPLFHKWFISHLSRSTIKNEEGLTRVQRIIKLSYDDISWNQKEFEGVQLFDRCGEFPNVPLLDTVGKKMLFIRAWSKIKKVGIRELGNKNYIPSDLYFRWIYDRVVEFGIPYPSNTPVVPRITLPVVPIVFEPYVPSPNEDLNVTVNQLKRERDDYKRRLQKVEAEKEVLIADAKEKEDLLDYFSRKWKIEDFVSPDQINSWEQEISRLVQQQEEMIKAHKEEVRVLKRKRRQEDKDPRI
ncbi:uncharacterized protein LOC131619475 [Vicia villosa]|uniref:uncharacterized protein LOC131619475 n=1 Tax=Vicia villosa TaxID=3911 RepID=UPI00273A96B8|nr:uncharacterized protein LOC131619475 [Vicia villosa]